MMSLLKAGDHVVATYPGYQSLYEIALSLGADVSYWEPVLTADGGAEFDVGALKVRRQQVAGRGEQGGCTPHLSTPRLCASALSQCPTSTLNQPLTRGQPQLLQPPSPTCAGGTVHLEHF